MTIRSIRQKEQWYKMQRGGTRKARMNAIAKRHPLTKQEARKLCEQAAQTHPITKIEDAKHQMGR